MNIFEGIDQIGLKLSLRLRFEFYLISIAFKHFLARFIDFIPS